MSNPMEYLIALVSVFCVTQASDPLSAGSGELVDYCTGTPLKADCGPSSVIIVTSATYGRMSIASKCIKQTPVNHCETSVLHVVDRYCSGRQECNMMVPNEDLDATEPCSVVFRFYLSASFVCVPVEVPNGQCQRTATVIDIYSHMSNISSLVTARTGCGTQNSPYILQAQPGQTLNITLTDFGWGGDSARLCGPEHNYGSLLDLSEQQQQLAICGGRERVRNFYMSKGPKVQIVISKREVWNNHFLLGVNAVGCPDILPQKHATVKRNADEVVISCKETHQTWHLKCQGHSWLGVIGNCTQYLAAKVAARGQIGGKFPDEIAIFIIFGIAVIICLVIITIGLFFLKREKKHRQQNMPKDYEVQDRQIYEEPKYKIRQPVYDPSVPKSTGVPKKNEYTHIWEHPLPEPCAAHGIPAVSSYDITSTHGPNVDQYGGSLDSKNMDSLSRYYALDRDSDGRINTSIIT